MPQRTNEFQELVSLVQKALVSSGAKVTDSPLVDVPGMSGPREIDILIESEVGPYRIKIAVEAKDHRRKLDSTQFESLIGKYFVEGGVKVNKVVVVTHNGFYNPVIERAKRIGVELLTLKEARNVDWQKYRPFAMPFKTTPRIGDIEISPPIGETTVENVIRDGRVSCSHGTQFGHLKQFAASLLINSALQNQEETLRQIDDAAASDPDGKKAKIEVTPDHPHSIRLNGREYPLEKLTFVAHFSKKHAAEAVAKSEFRFQFAPHICRISPEPSINVGTNNELRSEGRLSCTCCGKDHGTLNEWATRLVFENIFPRNPEVVRQYQQELSQSPVGQAWLNVNVPMGANTVIRFRGNDYAVTSISVGAHAVSAKAPIECKHYELIGTAGEKRLVSHLKATAGGKKFSIMIPHTEGGNAERIVVKIDDIQPCDSRPTDDEASGSMHVEDKS